MHELELQTDYYADGLKLDLAMDLAPDLADEGLRDSRLGGVTRIDSWRETCI